MSAPPDYAELHCLSCFSFQRGASMPQELFARAKQQRYRALAITDECTLAGIVRAKQAAAEHRLKLIVGNEMQLADGPRIVLLVESRTGYANLCRLITRARRRAAKGEYQLLRSDFDGHTDGLLALWLPARKPDVEQAHWLQSQFPQRCWLAVELHRGADDAARLQALLSLAHALQLPAVASGDVHMHVRKRRALQDTMTAIRLRTTLAQAGHALFPNGERHLRTRATLAALYPAQLLSETVRIAERCTFSLDELEYQYPHEIVPAGQTATTYLRQLVEDGIAQRWPDGFRDAAEARYVRGLIEKELELIADMKYEAYFLTVYDIVRFARSQAILCQGRGSAANSVVCYLLGITELRPGMTAMLFERFISKNRNEPPDIDVDFEHERREEVLQYVFNRYGRDRAALVAVVIQYRGRSAVRDVAGALGMPRDQIDELAHTMDRWSGDAPIPDYLRERGFDPDAPLMQRVIVLTGLLVGFPRHLSQHPGGFVISEQPLSTLVPVENAAMDGRTVVQWDKDDIDEVKMQKVDCLALGMLTCVRKTFQMLHASGRRPHFKAQDIPPDDASTFGMIQRADTVGVFQIESRAQMAMLPRLRPKTFYDLVVQIAIVRPGPIQGDMVHPYLRRRTGEEPESYPSDALKDVLSRTLGVPLFQEQVMQIAMVAANYSAEDADNLRRSMAAWKRRGGLDPHREKLLAGMLANGYPPEFAERIFEQIKGFGSYGFPESHAASFALIAWQSSWLKCHEPAAFAAALINSQPMGFYSPSQIVQDARRHGIEVRPVDVRYSDWDCTLESAASMPAGVGRPAKWRASGNAAGRLQRRAVNNETSAPISSTAHGGSFDDDMLVAIPAAQPALRLGLRLIDGLREGTARRIEAARTQRAFADLDELCRRAMLDARDRALLADAGALRGLVGHRHKARWAVAGVEAQRPLFDDVAATDEAPVALPLPSTEQDMRTDYATLGLTLGRHPLSLLRAVLRRRRFRRSQELLAMPHGRKVAFAGLVTLRQRPQTASGVTFLTLEDEDGLVNVVVWKHIAQQQRHELLQSRLLAVHGRLESQDGTRHLIADRLENLNELLGELDTSSRDFH